MNWQPISSAPRDGTIVLVFDGRDVCACKYSGANGEWTPMWGSDTELYFEGDVGKFHLGGLQGIMWMPLPTTPTIR